MKGKPAILPGRRRARPRATYSPWARRLFGRANGRTHVATLGSLRALGIAQGAQPITSYNYGAKNAARVKQTFFLLLKACLCYSGLLWLVIQLAPGLFASIFTSDAALIAFTGPALRIYCGGLLLMGAQIACQMTFISLGKAKESIIVAIMRKFVLLLPLIYLLPRLMENKTAAVYTAEPIADILAIIFTCVLFAWQFKKSLHALSAPAQPVAE